MMSEPSIEDYAIGWICALQEEYEAACRMLDDEFEGPEASDANDNNTYVFGRICKHNVVIGCLPGGRYGINSAAIVARDMVRSFPKLRFGLMVGIGGGAPTPDRDIRLGDVVISEPCGKFGGVLQYDFGKRLSGGRFQQTGQMNSPPAVLLGAIPEMRRRHNDPRKPDTIFKHLQLMNDMPDYQRPAEDRLYRSDYEHKGGATCADCGTDGLEERAPRAAQRALNTHYGTIASANSVMKNAKERDQLSLDPELNVLCFEMEAAGLMNNFPCLVIRGICDYCDSHKNDEWHKYAALAAAAYARELLHVLRPTKVTTLPPWADSFLENMSATSRKADKIIKYHRTQEQNNILNWLTPVDYGPQQSDYIGRRQQGTGKWVLQSAQFQAWLESEQKTLFCPGIPGAGKTIFTSTVVDSLQTRYRDDTSVGIAYIYCDYRRQDEQTAKDLLASLLKQLAECLPTFPEAMKSIYGRHKKMHSRPSFHEVASALETVLALYSRVFILVDALDECRESDHSRTKFVDYVFKLLVKSKLNVFATSRFIPDIIHKFEESIVLEIRATDEDVRQYIDGHMSRLPRFVQGNLHLQDEIKAGIVQSVQGMFLLVQLHVESLMGKISIKTLRTALARLPSGRDAYENAYATAMDRIEQQTAEQRWLAKRVLAWIVGSRRPLTALELQHALAVEHGETALDHDNLPDIEDMVSVCAGLVTVDEHSHIIRLVHYTAQEYFNKTESVWLPNADADIAATCVTYISFSIFAQGYCQTDDEFEERLRLNPFYDYSAKNWGHHVRTTSTTQGTIQFLQSERNVESAGQALLSVERPGLVLRYSQEVAQKIVGLHLAAYFGLEEAVLTLLPTCHRDLKDSHGKTPLSWAAQNGHENVAMLLLANGRSDVNSKDTKLGQTPLSLASEEGHAAVVKALLDRGADPNITVGPCGWTAATGAAYNGHAAVVEMLDDHGAETRSTYDTMGRTPLSWAARNGHEGVVEILLANNCIDVDSTDEIRGMSALSLAAREGHLSVVKRLTDHGADLESKDKQSWTALSWAAKVGHKGVIQLLLDKGAKSNLKYDANLSPVVPVDQKTKSAAGPMNDEDCAERRVWMHGDIIAPLDTEHVVRQVYYLWTCPLADLIRILSENLPTPKPLVPHLHLDTLLSVFAISFSAKTHPLVSFGPCYWLLYVSPSSPSFFTEKGPSFSARNTDPAELTAPLAAERSDRLSINRDDAVRQHTPGEQRTMSALPLLRPSSSPPHRKPPANLLKTPPPTSPRSRTGRGSEISGSPGSGRPLSRKVDAALLEQEAAEDRRLRADSKQIGRNRQLHSCVEDDETTPWLKHTGWPEFFEGRPLDIITTSATQPTAAPSRSQEDLLLGSWQGVPVRSSARAEARLRILMQAVDDIFDRAEATLAHTSYRSRCWISSYWRDTFYTRPLRVLPPRTKARYKSTWKEFICYLFRAIALEPQKRREIHNIPLRADEITMMHHVLSLASRLQDEGEVDGAVNDDQGSDRSWCKQSASERGESTEADGAGEDEGSNDEGEGSDIST
ncbi:hypothetical protein PCL_09519 [Purpureocillium lilacinum]|uniref:Uncharacterized protein n=1 Tax=Purpureocillium lilacinum TaxID=33203 RepID=A0A2U3DQS0_PURLI|nr:hypothetical protein PCL_09519 [Purpureocillium lilacinum]